MGRPLSECPHWYNSQSTQAVNNFRQQNGSTCGLHAANHILARACEQRGVPCTSFNKRAFEDLAKRVALGDNHSNLMQPGGSNYDYAVLHANLIAHGIHLFPLTPQDLESKLVAPFGIHTTERGDDDDYDDDDDDGDDDDDDDDAAKFSLGRAWQKLAWAVFTLIEDD